MYGIKLNGTSKATMFKCLKIDILISFCFLQKVIRYMTCMKPNKITRKRLPCLNVKKYKQLFLTALKWI